MRFLRTVSTRRLLAIVAGLLIAVAGGTAIAVAATNGGPTPPRESLAKALHQAATAPEVKGITAHITFTNHLISQSDLAGGADPILTGAHGRLWLSPSAHALRLELQGDGGDAQVVVSGGTFSVYDPMSNTVYKGTLPSQSSSSTKSTTGTIPSVAQIQTQLAQLMQEVNIIGPTPRNVAGQPAYKVRITPKHDGGLLGSIQLAWDAAHGVPLGIAIYSTQSPNPVLELKATDISYGPVSNGDLKVSAPHGAKVVRIARPGGQAAAAHAKAKHGKHAGRHETTVTGPAAVQAKLPFTLAAPDTLVGLPRQSVELLDWGGTPAALVTYGQGLGGIAVIEQAASAGQSTPQSQSQGSSRQPVLSLPTVSINGHTGQELPTALGTVIRVTSGGVQYTLLGSVLPQAAELAAKALIP